MRAQWEAERQALRKVQALRRRSNGSAWKPRRRSGTTTSTEPPSSVTGGSRSSSAGSRPKRTSWPPSRAGPACCARW